MGLLVLATQYGVPHSNIPRPSNHRAARLAASILCPGDSPAVMAKQPNWAVCTDHGRQRRWCGRRSPTHGSGSSLLGLSSDPWLLYCAFCNSMLAQTQSQTRSLPPGPCARVPSPRRAAENFAWDPIDRSIRTGSVPTMRPPCLVGRPQYRRAKQMDRGASARPSASAREPALSRSAAVKLELRSRVETRRARPRIVRRLLLDVPRHSHCQIAVRRADTLEEDARLQRSEFVVEALLLMPMACPGSVTVRLGPCCVAPSKKANARVLGIRVSAFLVMAGLRGGNAGPRVGRRACAAHRAPADRPGVLSVARATGSILT